MSGNGQFQKNNVPWNKNGTHSIESRKKISLSRLGKSSGMKGKHQSEETKKKLSESLKGRIAWNKGKKGSSKINSGSFKKGLIPWNKGVKISINKLLEMHEKGFGFKKGHFNPETGFKKGNKPWNAGLKGFLANENHYHWKGGITPLNLKIRKCFESNLWRSGVFKRDYWTCQTCGKRGVFLEAHHIKAFSKIMQENNIKTFEEALACSELWDLDNGVTLCKDCHNLTKSGRNIKGDF